MLGPLFSALHALAVDDASGGAGLTLRFLAAFDVQCMMDPIQRAVAMPPRKIVMQRAARRKVFWDVPPLAAGAQDVHHAVHDGPHVDPPLTAAASRGRDQRLDICPFVISQVARISQVIAVVLRPVLVRPQCRPLPESSWAPSNPNDSKDSRSLRTDTQTAAGISVSRQVPFEGMRSFVPALENDGMYLRTVDREQSFHCTPDEL